jgi:Tol biopolymer transport system component
VIDRDGAVKRLLAQPAVFPRQLVVSPNGERVAFVSGTDVWVVGTDGQGLTRITEDEGLDTSPSWSAAGDVLAFTSVEEPWHDEENPPGPDGTRWKENSDVYVASAATQWEPRNVTESKYVEGAPALSPVRAVGVAGALLARNR